MITNPTKGMYKKTTFLLPIKGEDREEEGMLEDLLVTLALALSCTLLCLLSLV